MAVVFYQFWYEVNMKHGVWVIILLSGLILTGCNDALKSPFSQSGNNVVPETFENPNWDDQSPEETTPPEEQQKPSKLTKPNKLTKPVKPNPSLGTPPVDDPDTSGILYYAQKVMEKEARKLGTACNFYVHRVLEVAGFVHHIYKANDFYLYPPKYFGHYKEVKFIRDSNAAAEIERLRKHLWSYSERTPFIMNWKRSGTHGHIAIVERVADKLVIYQASLGTKLPRKDQTTVESLLAGNRKNLTVYSEMTPK